MDRQALIGKLTPAHRYTDRSQDPLLAMRGRFLFAASPSNAGYFLLADEQGLQPLTPETYAQVVDEARVFGINLHSMRVFGARGEHRKAPRLHYFPVDTLVAA